MAVTQSDVPRRVLARPILVPKLSATSISYLERAQLQHDEFLKLQAIAKQKEKENHKSTFTVFPKLPPELRDKIWEWYALMCPRIVDVAMSPWNFTGHGKNQDLALMDINRQTRAETFSLHGYHLLDHPLYTLACLYNPSIDVLLLNDVTLRANYFDEDLICEMLEKANILDKVKFIVLEAPWNRRSVWMATFKKYTNLEVVLVVVETCDGRGGSESVEFEPFGTTNGRNFRYQLMMANTKLTRAWERNHKSIRAYRAELESEAMRIIDIDDSGTEGLHRVVPTVLLARHVWID